MPLQVSTCLFEEALVLSSGAVYRHARDGHAKHTLAFEPQRLRVRVRHHQPTLHPTCHTLQINQIPSRALQTGWGNDNLQGCGHEFVAHMTYVLCSFLSYRTSLWNKCKGSRTALTAVLAPYFRELAVRPKDPPCRQSQCPPRWVFFSYKSLLLLCCAMASKERRVGATFVVPLHHSPSVAIPTHLVQDTWWPLLHWVVPLQVCASCSCPALGFVRWTPCTGPREMGQLHFRSIRNQLVNLTLILLEMSITWTSALNFLDWPKVLSFLYTITLPSEACCTCSTFDVQAHVVAWTSLVTRCLCIWRWRPRLCDWKRCVLARKRPPRQASQYALLHLFREHIADTFEPVDARNGHTNKRAERPIRDSAHLVEHNVQRIQMDPGGSTKTFVPFHHGMWPCWNRGHRHFFLEQRLAELCLVCDATTSNLNHLQMCLLLTKLHLGELCVNDGTPLCNTSSRVEPRQCILGRNAWRTSWRLGAATTRGGVQRCRLLRQSHSCGASNPGRNGLLVNGDVAIEASTPWAPWSLCACRHHLCRFINLLSKTSRTMERTPGGHYVNG